jgi:hypothetical protein
MGKTKVVTEWKSVDVSTSAPKLIDNCRSWPRYDPSLALWVSGTVGNCGPMGMKHAALWPKGCLCKHMRPLKKKQKSGVPDERQMGIDMSILVITPRRFKFRANLKRRDGNGR